ncbi:C4-dicarboxylate ABC transporter [Mameliella alba]|uniref:YfcC family protein n=1 Tax=Mameliella TaxID=1434019 RepID=UPI0008410A35|nr:MULTISPECIES: AbgT family transporter [Mameliella]MBY6122570.1 AbgT family transporter [Mameliella alba]MDD9731507.1 AbgT family transporter [Mameliella sp. AT18]ODM46167.1 C4-dicarboxylate ABC transporter [Ruegeria sp. PBVC088]BBU59092.1 C4-dicarboxylate ABC transporter [Mameliella alba]
MTAENTEVDETEAPGFRMPHIYVILFVFTAIAAALTHVIPAGLYDRVTLANGRSAIDPTSYREVPATPVGLEQFMLAVPNGLVDAATVVFFTFIIGGTFMVVRRTGLIDVAVDKLARRFSSRSLLMFPVLMTVFAVVASLIGTQELALVYVPVILPLMIALGYDSVTAAATALLATTAGFTAGVLNPINTGLGQTIAELPLYSGAGLRATLFVVLLVVAVLHTIRYARRVRANPDDSLMAGDSREEAKRGSYRHDFSAEPMRFSRRQAWAGLVTLGFFAILVWGVLTRGWFMLEMAGLFVLMGVAVGLVAGLNTARICDAFNEGFRDVLMGAIIVGLARAVAVMFEQGQVMDTLVHGLGGLVGSFPDTLSAVGMFLSQLGFNFVIPSGSGQALVTMPIMAPLSDLIGVTRQNAVLAYQLGDGLSNIFYPTSGYFMATLALAGVGWDRWIRFFLPLFVTWIGIAIAFLVFAQATNWTG